MLETLVLVTDSTERTSRVGALLGASLSPGDVVALGGELGTGKTVLAKGIAGGLGVRPDEVKSPTFTLVRRHQGGRLPLVHIDAYRLRSAEDLLDLGIEEVLDPLSATVVEWAPRVAAALPADRLEVALTHEGKTRRRLRFEARGRRSAALLAALRGRLEAEGFRAEHGVAQ